MTDFDPALVEKAARRSHPSLWRNRNKSPEYTMAWEHHLSVARAVIAAVPDDLRAEPWHGCTGDYDCPKDWHEHGCYADKGQCSDPLDHAAVVRIEKGCE